MHKISQLELIAFPPPLYQTTLEAVDSPKRAYYKVSVYHLMDDSGYLIQKASGGQKSKPNIETWFRPNLRQALEKKAQLINAKLNRKVKGRIYTIVDG
jgi:hypothetical protein